MALIPTYSRQKSIPGTTGVSDPAVALVKNPIPDAANNFFNKLGQVGEVVLKQQTESDLSAASAKITIGMAGIESELAKVDGMAAPNLFDDKANELYQDAFAGVTTPEARRTFESKFGLIAAKSKIQITSSGLIRKNNELRADMIATNDNQINMIGVGVSATMRNTILQNVMENVDRAVLTGFMKPDVAAKEKIRLRSDIAKNGIASWVNSTTKEGLLNVYDQMDTGVFTGSNAKQNAADWGSLTAIEREAIRQRTSRELESLQTLKDREEREEEKQLKVKQTELYGSVYGLIMTVGVDGRDRKDLPTLGDLELMKQQRQITGTQQAQLSALLKTVDEAKTDESVLLGMQNEVYDLADLTEDERNSAIAELRGRMVVLSTNGELEATHATGLNSLIDRVSKGGFKFTPQAKARVSLKRILGASDPDFSIPGFRTDPQAQARIQRVLNEYDYRVADGEAPWDLHKELLGRAQIEIPKLSSIPKPLFGPSLPLDEWTNKDVQDTTEALSLALSEQRITNAAYKASFNYLEEISSILAQKKLLSEADNASPPIDLSRRKN